MFLNFLQNDPLRCIYGASAGDCTDSAVFQQLTHSDEFVPECMQITRNITYVNVDVSRIVKYTTALTDPEGVTVSGRLQNWIDSDSSVYRPWLGQYASRFEGKATQIGSMRSVEWWRMNPDCIRGQDIGFPMDEVWLCPFTLGVDSSASLVISYNEAAQAKIGTNVCVNGNWNGKDPCPVVGTVSHWGRPEAYGLALALNSKITGPIMQDSGGWFIRFKSGTPATLDFIEMMISNNDKLFVAIPYPVGTKFKITGNSPSWCGSGWALCQVVFQPVTSLAAMMAGSGDTYFVDSHGTLYFRIVQQSGTLGPAKGSWSIPVTPTFERAGLSLMLGVYGGLGTSPAQTSGYYLRVQALSCTTGTCAPQPKAPVPPALVPQTFTEAPTSKSPTRLPTRHPNKKPIKSPTKKPTKAPTKKPTKAPTKHPVKKTG